MIDIKIFFNQNVVHKKWGTGIVRNVDEEHISVYFEKTETGARTVQFQFPQVFNAEFLVFEDRVLNKKIKDVIESRACFFCQNTVNNTKIIDGVRTCDTCAREHTIQCEGCRTSTLKSNATSAIWNATMYKRVKLCRECLKSKTFQCDKCNDVFSKSAFREKIFSNKSFCGRCFSQVASECHICGKAYKHSNGESLYTHKDGYIEICESCLETNTFKCSVCKSTVIVEDRFISSKIKLEENVCRFCAVKCFGCGEFVAKNQSHEFDNKKYCQECWEKLSISCQICGNEFVPQKESDCLCPNCIESKAYESRLIQIGLPSLPYKKIKYSQLDVINRCQLFTNLYSFCVEDMAFQQGKRDGDPFKYLVMDILGHVVVITYLSKEVVGNVRYSGNVTMTEFRSQKGKFKVYRALREWKDTSTTTIQLPEGELKILNYPLCLRVQTSYDKCYGKEWRGPYDYIEICNYGDTTDFFIIGFL